MSWLVLAGVIGLAYYLSQ